MNDFTAGQGWMHVGQGDQHNVLHAWLAYNGKAELAAPPPAPPPAPPSGPSQPGGPRTAEPWPAPAHADCRLRLYLLRQDCHLACSTCRRGCGCAELRQTGILTRVQAFLRRGTARAHQPAPAEDHGNQHSVLADKPEGEDAGWQDADLEEADDPTAWEGLQQDDQQLLSGAHVACAAELVAACPVQGLVDGAWAWSGRQVVAGFTLWCRRRLGHGARRALADVPQVAPHPERGRARGAEGRHGLP